MNTPEAATPVPAPATELEPEPEPAPIASASQSASPAEQAPPAAAYTPDATVTRSALGMLSNVMNQAVVSPGSDFIGRLAAASAFWQPANQMLPEFPGATRAYRVGVGASQLFVVDDGAGNNVTVLIPRADVDLAHTLLEQAVELGIPSQTEAEPDTEPAPAEGSKLYRVSIAGKPVGSLTIGPVPDALAMPGLAMTWVADPVAAPTPEELAAAAHDGPSYTKLPDGSIELVSGTVIRGDGTPANPYAITWELLASAERLYQPRNGLTTLPDWCTALHEKHVRITGHLLSPLMMDDTTQILLMRNQWDGCCVGVPPTPYDAVEVELARPVSLVREQLNYGTITGYFEVDPYLVNNWLVGLWLLSDAKLEAANAQNWSVPAGAPN